MSVDRNGSGRIEGYRYRLHISAGTWVQCRLAHGHHQQAPSIGTRSQSLLFILVSTRIWTSRICVSTRRFTTRLQSTWANKLTKLTDCGKQKIFHLTSKQALVGWTGRSHYWLDLFVQFIRSDLPDLGHVIIPKEGLEYQRWMNYYIFDQYLVKGVFLR